MTSSGNSLAGCRGFTALATCFSSISGPSSSWSGTSSCNGSRRSGPPDTAGCAGWTSGASGWSKTKDLPDED